MLTRLRLRDFKSFDDASLELGGLTVIIGVNASGKSNIRDALRFLHGIGRGYSLAEIIGGKYGEGGYREWSPLRGTTNEIIRFGQEAFALRIEADTPEGFQLDYEIEVVRDHQRGTFLLRSESLQTREQFWKPSIFQQLPDPDDADDPDDMAFRLRASEGSRGQGKRLTLRRDRPALTQLVTKAGVSPALRAMIAAMVSALAEIRFLDLSIEAMRQPSFPGQTVLGEGGENLATVLQAICADDERKRTLIAWISELTPLEVADFAFETDATGRVLLFIVDGDGSRTSSFSASDGTLRFLAMAASLMDTKSSGLLFFEEIDNGLHPSRMRILTELIERRVALSRIQVVTTTHSPDLLTIVGDDTFRSTSLVYRAPDRPCSIVRRVADLPHVVKLREEQTLGRLHASGWFEDVVYFDETPEAAE